jgi:hypothetical protein
VAAAAAVIRINPKPQHHPSKKIMPRKLDSVLARFEETIEQNNAAGVCSGMYLTNQASRHSSAADTTTTKTKVTTAKAKPSPASGRRGSGLESSLPQIKPGTYRNMLKSTNTDATTVSTADTVESDDWDPFNSDGGASRDNNKFDESFSSMGDCSLASFEDDDAAEHRATLRRERPKKDRKSSGRRGTRVTKSQKQRRDSVVKTAASLEDTAAAAAAVAADDAEKEEDNNHDMNNDDDDDDDDQDNGFALTYVSAREKFTALTKQNSDRQLCKQPSRRKLLLGLEMTSKDGNRPLAGDSNHSSGSATPHNGRRSSIRSRSNRKLLDDGGDDGGSGGGEKAPTSRTTRRALSNRLLDNVDCSRSASTSPLKMHRSTRETAIGSSSHHRSPMNTTPHNRCSGPDIPEMSDHSSDSRSPTQRMIPVRSSPPLVARTQKPPFCQIPVTALAAALRVGPVVVECDRPLCWITTTRAVTRSSHRPVVVPPPGPVVKSRRHNPMTMMMMMMTTTTRSSCPRFPRRRPPSRRAARRRPVLVRSACANARLPTPNHP